MEKTKPAYQTRTKDFLALALPWCVDNNYSFSLWKLPDSESIHFAASASIKELNEINFDETFPGFVFSPFNPAKKKLLIPADEYVIFDNDIIGSANVVHLNEFITEGTAPGNHPAPTFYRRPQERINDSGKEDFFRLVNQCREEVTNGKFEKIVPSRSKAVPLPKNFDLIETFHKLVSLYPRAMVSIFSSPLAGTWMGATPELLVCVDRTHHFRTVAVAGTQPYLENTDLRNVTWTQKDIEEQALVERYIISCFKKIRLREYEEQGPRTVIAGNVLHLKTDFDVDMAATNFPQLGTVMLKLLHPTSAVCGMPMEASLSYLEANEGYDRQFYSGYLGPVNVGGESNLYVNLRCMQLQDQHAILYAGAGVLSDSDPEKEWSETEMKMNTLGKAIRQ